MSATNNSDTSTSFEAGRTGNVAFQALTAFAGTFTPQQVRVRMTGPHLMGSPSTIWRRTTIQHSNADGFYCLYACERTGQAIWVPCVDFFVTNRPRGTQHTGTVMDYLFSQRTRAVVPEGYGIHSTGRTASGENGNILRPRGNHGSIVGRPERGGPTRLHRFNPLVRPEPAAAGAGRRRKVVRRERRLRERGLDNPPPPPPTIATNINAATTSTVRGDVNSNNEGGSKQHHQQKQPCLPSSQPSPSTTAIIGQVVMVHRNNWPRSTSLTKSNTPKNCIWPLRPM
jgi:hypothetical protein